MDATTMLSQLEVREVGHLQVVSDLWDELGFGAIIDESIGADEQVQLRPGMAVKALCLNLMSGRDALYRVESFFEAVPTELLLGEGVAAEQLNDDALGRHLDRLFDANGEKVFNALSLRAISHERLGLKELHGDTTSKLVFGEYTRGYDEAVSVTYGHSKDHRPDLLQVMVGLVTTADGVPVLAEMLSGNKSDKTWYGETVAKLREGLQLGTKQPVHFVGDSALVTQENLDAAARCGIQVTGRLPRTVAVCNELVAAAVKRNQWQDLGDFSETTGAAKYQGQWFEASVLGHRLQGAVYRSSHLNLPAIEAAQRRQQRDCAAARREAKQLMRESYACEADAKKALEQFVAAHQGKALRLEGKVVRRKMAGRYARRGRPTAGQKRPMSEQIGVDLAVEVDGHEAEKAVADQSCFVLVHLGKDKLTAAELLRAYKAQGVVETRFPFLKDTNWCDRFFVKQVTRVEALGYVMLIALLLWSIWERRVRRALQASGEKPLKDVTGMPKKRPTAAVCVHIMRGVRVGRLAATAPWQPIGQLTPDQARITRFSRARVN